MLQQAMGQQLYSCWHGIKPNTWQTLLLQRNLEGGGPSLCIIFNPAALVDSRKPAARGGKAGPAWGTYAHSCKALEAPCNQNALTRYILQEKLKCRKRAWLAVFSCASRTYQTEAGAIQTLLGMAITVTGRTLSWPRAKESSTASLKQTVARVFSIGKRHPGQHFMRKAIIRGDY